MDIAPQHDADPSETEAWTESFAEVIRSGGGSNSNGAVLVTLPCGVTTVIEPEMASGGTSGRDAQVDVVRRRVAGGGAGAGEQDGGCAGEVRARELQPRQHGRVPSLVLKECLRQGGRGLSFGFSPGRAGALAEGRRTRRWAFWTQSFS